MRTHLLSTLSHLERVAHKLGNLLLHFLYSTHRHGDGRKIKWTWEMIQIGKNTGNPQGIGVARVSTWVFLQGFEFLGIQQWQIGSLLAYLVHSSVQVTKVQHGPSSPLGTRSSP
jgi:hypothetical protein